MKIYHLFAGVALVFLIGAGCQNQTQKQSIISPATVSELQNQTVPESPRQGEGNKMTAYQTRNSAATYRGSWFAIEYPKGFIASPSATTVYNGKTYVDTDEASFVSPDGTVEFFVFSPLWSGDPENYLAIDTTEKLVSEKSYEESNRSGDNLVKQTTHWVTVKAKNGSYYRSFVSSKKELGTDSAFHHVFGIKYRDDQAYERYRGAYAAFKKSLVQYYD